MIDYRGGNKSRAATDSLQIKTRSLLAMDYVVAKKYNRNKGIYYGKST